MVMVDRKPVRGIYAEGILPGSHFSSEALEEVCEDPKERC